MVGLCGRWALKTQALVASRVVATALALACLAPPATPNLDPISAEETMQLFLFSHQPSAGYDGHGFILRRDGQRPLGITAYHVAGPVITGPVDPESPQPTAWLHSIVDTPVQVRLGQRLPIAGAQTIGAGSSQRDVAAYTVIDFIQARSLELAPVLPAVGDTVYVLALHQGNDPRNGPRRHPARVTAASDEDFRYLYLDSKNTGSTSGAAVLGRDGRVVGLNVGTDARYGGDTYGMAVGVNSLRALLPPN